MELTVTEKMMIAELILKRLKELDQSFTEASAIESKALHELLLKIK
jgi:hypothetical protein